MAYKYYVPVKCSMKECGFYLMTCEMCVCNKSRFGTKALTIKDPHNNYKFVLDMTLK